jgi:hypothetical protein
MSVPFYDTSSMWGPQGDPNAERPRLKPGDRLSDGRVFMGDNPEAVLLAELARIEEKIRPLDEQRQALLNRLHDLAPQKYKASGDPLGRLSPQGDGPVVTAVTEETPAAAAPAATAPARSAPARKKAAAHAKN